MGHPADADGPAAGEAGEAVEDLQPFVRPARLTDAEAFAAVQHRSWAHAAREEQIPPPPELDEMARAWERAIALPPSPRHRSWIAVDRSMSGEAVRGVAVSVPASDPDLDAEHCVEVVVLAVDPDARGRGHGSRLVAAAMEGAARDEAVEAVMWVASDDDVTRSFLEGSGWATDGAFRTLGADAPDDALEDAPVAELRQVRLATSLRDDPALDPDVP